MMLQTTKKNSKQSKHRVAKPGPRKPIQFNWRRHWSKKVSPYLHEPLVQASLNYGMTRLDANWRPGHPPCVYGSFSFRRIVNHKLSWYQPLQRCHWIAFFSMAIGVLNYPNLDWRFVSGDLHTVPVGYGPDGEPRVVMDILLFDYLTAEESIAYARKKDKRLMAKTRAEVRKRWDHDARPFIKRFGLALTSRARELYRLRSAAAIPSSVEASAA